MGQASEGKKVIEVRNTGLFPVPGILERMLLVLFRFQLNRNFGYQFLPLKTEVSSFIQYYSRYILLVFVAFGHVYRLVLVFISWNSSLL